MKLSIFDTEVKFKNEEIFCADFVFEVKASTEIAIIQIKPPTFSILVLVLGSNLTIFNKNAQI